MIRTTQEIHRARPLSPHLNIYRKQISSVLSIFHRLTGMLLFSVLSLAAWWFILWVFSKFDPSYLQVTHYLPFKLVLILTSVSSFYHLCTGIRHLIWDTGRCFSIKAINISGWTAVGSSLIMTIIFWVFIV